MVACKGKPPKLQPRWQGPFRIKDRAGQASYRLVNLDGSHVRGDPALGFHEDALKAFVPRTGYLKTSWDQLCDPLVQVDWHSDSCWRSHYQQYHYIQIASGAAAEGKYSEHDSG